MPDTITTTEYTFAYKEPKHGWVSGAQTYTDRDHCIGCARRYGVAMGVPVRLQTRVIISSYEDLPPN